MNEELFQESGSYFDDLLLIPGYSMFYPQKLM